MLTVLLPAVSKMAFGNRLGFTFDENLAPADLFDTSKSANIILEVSKDDLDKLPEGFVVVGTVAQKAQFVYKDTVISMDEALLSWTDTLEKVFPTRSYAVEKTVDADVYKADKIYVCKNKVAKPTVFIPVFPGTNCEYDSVQKHSKEPVLM